MKPFKSDPAIYFLLREGILKGLSGSYVDDLVRAGKQDFRGISAKTNERFEMKEDSALPSAFTGFILDKRAADLLIDQKSYLRKLEKLDEGATFGQFRSMRMRLAWLANSRPDCLFEINQLAQITEHMFKDRPNEMVRRLNKAIRYATENQVRLKIPKLDVESLRIVGFSDASFANNADLLTQLGHVFFLTDECNKAAPITIKSFKCRRATRSAMAGDVIAFSDMFDVAVTLAEELETVLCYRPPPHALANR